MTHFVVAGLARNLAKTLRETVRMVDRELSQRFDLSWIIVESDSDDDTDQVLAGLAEELPNFHAVSLGKLEVDFPNRIERIAHCRNQYMQVLDTLDMVDESTWLLILDLDDVTERIPGDVIEKCISSGLGTGYFANQAAPYYDIYALRCEGWSDDDAFAHFEKLVDEGWPIDKAHREAILKRMKVIPPESLPIEVKSAFGGLAVYKANIAKSCRYLATQSGGRHICEHVSFNEQFRAKGGSLFIWPSLINGGFNQHNRYLRPERQLIQPAIAAVRILVKTFLGHKTAGRLASFVNRRTGL